MPLLVFGPMMIGFGFLYRWFASMSRTKGGQTTWAIATLVALAVGIACVLLGVIEVMNP